MRLEDMVMADVHTDWQPAHGEPRLSPSVRWDWLQPPHDPRMKAADGQPTESGSSDASPSIPSVCMCRSSLLRPTLDNILRHQGYLAKVKIPFGDSQHPSSIWKHAYTPPLLSSFIPPRPQSNPAALLSPPSNSSGGLKALL